ncbi:MAG: hypothetical protein M1819_004860 [Sarea resinae]|nr:MAG: hypothetical protein M1819_004860 [Sarea resinae]
MVTEFTGDFQLYCHREAKISKISKTSMLAILEKNDAAAVLHFHEKITADNSQYRGIHPIASLDSHQGNLAKLVNKAIASLPRAAHGIPGALTTIERSGEEDTDMDSGSGSMLANGVDVKKPDFISVTRGPGMRSSLSAGLDLAKGLAVAWQVPLVGVNHMQAHALTPRLVSALDQRTRHPVAPAFPFLSLLVSGGHTLLVHSQDLIQHKILASTTDIAVGEAIDKMARTILPDKLLEESRDTMYGPLIERFAFPGESSEYNYTAPVTREKELARKPSSWGWAYGPPLAETKKGSRAKAMEFSFSGLASATERFVQKADHEVTLPERVDLSKEAMRVSFEHLASRVVMGLNNMKRDDPIAESAIRTLVVSGGVASNQYLKVM